MPEKTVQEVSRELRSLYEKGNAAAQRDNFDYAITIFTQVLQQEPAFFECRQSLRATQFKKQGMQTSFFKKVLGTTANSPMIAKAQLQLRSNPKEALNAAEQMLNSDPNNAPAHKLLAEAALLLDLPKTAVFSLETVRGNNPKDRDIALTLARAYAAAAQFSNAETIYSELLKANPRDAEIHSLLKDISAKKTLEEKGYEKLAEGKGSYRDILKDKNEAISLEQESKQVRSEDVIQKLIDENEEKLRNDPADFKLARQIADLYADLKNYRKATSYYRQLLAIEGVADATMEGRYNELYLKYLDQQISQLDPQAPDHAERSAQLIAEKNQYTLDDIKRRVDKYPNDLQIRYEYGVNLFKTGKIQEAIQEFQKSQNNANRRVQSLTYLGQCFYQRGMNDLAVKFFQNAIKEKPGFDEEKKDMVYSLGLVLEKMGKSEEAIEQFKQIYETDIGYRDVSAKVDAYYGGKS